jgi:guanosine-3',5'-bis(diphosphate) 3'-pyrophosphohydrolase
LRGRVGERGKPRALTMVSRALRNDQRNGKVEAETEVAMLSPIRLVSKAAEFAAHRHNGKARKARPDEPYINHLAEVANILAEVTDGADAELVAAGWLHDTVEDELATLVELMAEFGDRVAALVDEVTDDMSLPTAKRRQKQVADAPHKSPGAKLIKIADKISNIRARIHADPNPEQRNDLAAYTIWAEDVVAGCRGINSKLDARFDEAVITAKSAL